MTKVTVSMLLIGIMVVTSPAIAQDFGTEIPITFPGETEMLSMTDWSPDGKWIAFSRKMNDGEWNYNIWIVSTIDGTKKNLTGEIEDKCYIPIFTPDGDEVMFSRWTSDGETKQLSSAIESVNIYTGDNRVVMEEAYAGSMSRDGKYIISNYWPDPDNHVNHAYKLYDVEEDETTIYDFYDNFPDPPFYDSGQSQMSPDNSHFVTTMLTGWHQGLETNPHALYRVALDGSIIEEITSDGSPWYPKFSPDGKWILYTRWDHTEMDEERNKPARDIYVYSEETGEIINLLPDNPYDSWCASFSPDGSKICYILDEDGEYSLYIKDFEFASDSEEIQVSVEDDLPSGFALSGNYPNPFNPTTTIEFSLHETGFAGLAIYNLAGQKIRRLVSGTLSEGVHSVAWNGCDDSGLAVSNGVYLARLTMGEAVTTSRMVLVK